jgi:hypothetical protein
MKVIDRYVYDVTRRLPEKQRVDVARELTSEIYDMVVAEAREKKPTSKHAETVLLRMGRPAKLADSYRDRPRYIIGPEYYEAYFDVLKTILITVLPIVAVITLIAQMMATDANWIQATVQGVGMAVQTGIHIFFWTTLSFFFVDKVTEGRRYDEEQEWSIDDLPELPVAGQASRAQMYFEATVTVIWAVFFVGVLLLQIPAIHDFFQPAIPLFFAIESWAVWVFSLIAITLLGVISGLTRTIRGWKKSTVWTVAVINTICTIILLGAFILAQPIVNPAFAELMKTTLELDMSASYLQVGVVMFIYVTIVVYVWEIIDAVIKYKKGAKV